MGSKKDSGLWLSTKQNSKKRGRKGLCGVYRNRMEWEEELLRKRT